MPLAIHPDKTLLFIGDSITDCGRRDASTAPLGSGYVRIFADLVKAREPRRALRILNRGVGGNTVDDLRSRWHEDALLHRPDWLSVKIGINDLNLHLCHPEFKWLTLEKFHEIYEGLLRLTREQLPECGLLLISPFFLSTDTTPGSYRARVLAAIPGYVDTVRRLAAAHNARFLDLHALFQDRLRNDHPEVFAPEPVHPHSTGHMVIADAVYQALS